MLICLPDDPRGKHGIYTYITADLGAKVYSRDTPVKARTEFLLNRYAQDSGLTSEVFSFERGLVIIKGRTVSRPFIYMRHIAGITADTYAKRLGWGHNPGYAHYDALSWGAECVQFRPIIRQMCDICDELQRLGFSCDDHLDNWGNFMVEDITRCVKAIDFSKESVNSIAMRKICQRYMIHMTDKLPEHYISLVIQN